jgi:hypothetical protein
MPLPLGAADALAGASVAQMHAALGLLDSPAEQRFDDLGRLAATLCGGGASFITLVDRAHGRLFFKSAHLASAPAQAAFGGVRELPLPDGLPSFCAHCAETSAPLTVLSRSATPGAPARSLSPACASTAVCR